SLLPSLVLPGRRAGAARRSASPPPHTRAADHLGHLLLSLGRLGRLRLSRRLPHRDQPHARSSLRSRRRSRSPSAPAARGATAPRRPAASPPPRATAVARLASRSASRRCPP